MKNLESVSQVVLEALVADQAHCSHQRPCRSVLADQAALRATWMPSLWVHAAWAPLDLLVELEAAKAAVKRLAPLAPLADVVDLDHVAAAVVVEPISAKHCEMADVDQRHHLERGPW